jgi:hypothetical protein
MGKLLIKLVNASGSLTESALEKGLGQRTNVKLETWFSRFQVGY